MAPASGRERSVSAKRARAPAATLHRPAETARGDAKADDAQDARAADGNLQPSASSGESDRTRSEAAPGAPKRASDGALQSRAEAADASGTEAPGKDGQDAAGSSRPQAAAPQDGQKAARAPKARKGKTKAAAAAPAGSQPCAGKRVKVEKTDRGDDYDGSRYWIPPGPADDKDEPGPSKRATLSAEHAEAQLGWDRAKFQRVEALVKANLVSKEGSSKNVAADYKDEEAQDLRAYFNLKERVEGRLAVKGFRIAGVTKSCHQCQYQHTFRQCECTRDTCECRAGTKARQKGAAAGSRGGADGAFKCAVSVCRHCIEHHYATTGWDYDRNDKICPRCRDVCNCRHHLREKTYGAKPPAYSPVELAERAEVNLALICAVVVETVTAWCAEAAHDSITDLFQVPQAELEKGERVLCGRCHTHIANLHRACKACSAEVCVRCCGELRRQRPAPDGELPCPNPACRRAPLTLSRLMPDDPTRAMLEVADKRDAIESWLTGDVARRLCGANLATGVLPTQLHDLWFRQDLPAVPDAPAAAEGLGAPETDDAALGTTPAGRSAAAGLGPDSEVPRTLQELRERLKALDGREHWAPTQDEIGEMRKSSQPQAPRPDNVVSPDEWTERRRLTAWKLDESEQHLLCLEASDIMDVPAEVQGEAREVALKRVAAFKREMWRRWQLGQPVLVRNVKGKVPWNPACMSRATRELGNKAQKAAALVGEEGLLQVQRCSDWKWIPPMSQKTFFRAYERGGINYDKARPADVTMLKLKDFPATSSFPERLRRHHQDFLELLPWPEVCHLGVAPHNLALTVPADANPCDLGPKCYVAFGRPAEMGAGDSVTKVHLDMADAVNVTLHQQGLNPAAANRVQRSGDEVWQPPCYQGAGAVWDIWQRKDLEALRKFMRETLHLVDDGTGQPLTLEPWEDPVHSQRYMFTDDLRRLLWHRCSVQAWHFEQHLGEAVFIPAGCAHQVRNLDSCIKVAVDFVSPHNLALCLHMAKELRLWRDPEEALSYSAEQLSNEERLAAESILVHAVHRMLPLVRHKL